MRVDPSTGLLHRPIDRVILREVAAVHADLPIRPDDVFLDLGAHIGAASRLALAKGAARVIAVEADPANLAFLRRNLAHRPATVIWAAVGGSSGHATLHASRAGHLSSVVATERGRTDIRVPMVTLESFLAHRPTVVKCDIEFGEYALSELRALPASVRVLAMEVHVRPDLVFRGSTAAPWRRQAAELIDAIERQGFVRSSWRVKERPGTPVEDATGLPPLASSVDATWVRGLHYPSEAA